MIIQLDFFSNLKNNVQKKSFWLFETATDYNKCDNSDYKISQKTLKSDVGDFEAKLVFVFTRGHRKGIEPGPVAVVRRLVMDLVERTRDVIVCIDHTRWGVTTPRPGAENRGVRYTQTALSFQRLNSCP